MLTEELFKWDYTNNEGQYMCTDRESFIYYMNVLHFHLAELGFMTWSTTDPTFLSTATNWFPSSASTLSPAWSTSPTWTTNTTIATVANINSPACKIIFIGTSNYCHVSTRQGRSITSYLTWVWRDYRIYPFRPFPVSFLSFFALSTVRAQIMNLTWYIVSRQPSHQRIKWYMVGNLASNNSR